MIRLAAVVLAASGAWGADFTMARSALVQVEQQFDERLSRFNPEDPFFLLGTTRAVYLPGYGVVISAEVNLASGPGLSPFRPQFGKEELARLRQTKLDRLPKLRATMKDLLLGSAATLLRLPESERIVLAITLLNKSWEDTTGLPAQIVMMGQRGELGRARTSANLEAAAVQVKEY